MTDHACPCGAILTFAARVNEGRSSGNWYGCPGCGARVCEACGVRMHEQCAVCWHKMQRNRTFPLRLLPRADWKALLPQDDVPAEDAALFDLPVEELIACVPLAGVTEISEVFSSPGAGAAWDRVTQLEVERRLGLLDHLTLFADPRDVQVEPAWLSSLAALAERFIHRQDRDASSRLARRELLVGLGKLTWGTPSALEHVLAAATDADPALRSDALVVIERLRPAWPALRAHVVPLLRATEEPRRRAGLELLARSCGGISDGEPDELLRLISSHLARASDHELDEVARVLHRDQGAPFLAVVARQLGCAQALLSPLLALLERGPPGRRRAIQYLGALGAASAPAIGALQRVMRSDRVHLQALAARALVELGAQEAVPYFQAALASDSWESRLEALESLILLAQAQGHEATLSAHRERLLGLLRGLEAPSRARAILLVASWKSEARRAVAPALDLHGALARVLELEGTVSEIPWSLGEAALAWIMEDGELRRRVVQQAQKRGGWLASAVLPYLGAEDARAQLWLQRLLSDRGRPTSDRANIVGVFGRLAAAGGLSAGGILVEVFLDPQERALVRLAAAEALFRLQSAGAPMDEPCKSGASDPRPIIRAAALLLKKALGRDTAPEGDADPSPLVQFVAAEK